MFHIWDICNERLHMHRSLKKNFNIVSHSLYFLSSKTPSNSHRRQCMFPCIRCISCRTLWLSHHRNFHTVPKTPLESAWIPFRTVRPYHYYPLHSFNHTPLTSPAIANLGALLVLMPENSTVCMKVCKNCGLQYDDDSPQCTHCHFNIQKPRI